MKDDYNDVFRDFPAKPVPNPTPDQPPLCANCRHSFVRYASESGELPASAYSCRHPDFMSVVTGKVDPWPCTEARRNSNHWCGQAGRWFEPRQTTEGATSVEVPT